MVPKLRRSNEDVVKIFWTKKQLAKHDEQVRINDRHEFMQGTARNAAKNAIHYYVVFRTLGWWRETIDEAEKNGNKYMSLAEGFIKIQKENDANLASDD